MAQFRSWRGVRILLIYVHQTELHAPYGGGKQAERSIHILDVIAAQRLSSRLEFGVGLGKVLLPRVLKYLTRRMPPTEEVTWREAERRGQGDERRKEILLLRSWELRRFRIIRFRC